MFSHNFIPYWWCQQQHGQHKMAQLSEANKEIQISLISTSSDANYAMNKITTMTKNKDYWVIMRIQITFLVLCKNMEHIDEQLGVTIILSKKKQN
jgi:hypothetical protein